MPLSEQERQQLLSIKSSVSQVSTGGGPQQTQFDPGQQTGRPTFGEATQINPLRALGSFLFGVTNQAAFGLPAAGLELAGQEPPPFGLLGGARGAGELVGFGIGGPAALARRGFGAVAKRLGAEKLLPKALAFGTGGGAAVGGSSVVPSLMEGEPGRIPQQAALGFGTSAIGGPILQKLLRGRQPDLLPDESLLGITKAQQRPKIAGGIGRTSRARSFELKEARIKARIEQLKSEAQIKAEGVRTGIQSRAADLRRRVTRGVETRVTELETKTFRELRTSRIEGNRAVLKFTEVQGRLNKAVEGSNFELSKRLQDILPRSMNKISSRYRQLSDAALVKSKNVQISEKDLLAELETVFADNPRALNTASEVLGIGRRGTSIAGRSSVSPREAAIDLQKLPPNLREQLLGPDKTFTARELLDGVRKFRASIGASRRAGRVAYTRDDMIADNISDTVMNVIKNRAPQEASQLFNEANSLWAQYKPLQRQFIGDFDPFRGRVIPFRGGMGEIEKAVSGEPNAINYIKQLEQFTNVSIRRDPKLVKLISELSSSQRTQAAGLFEQSLAKDGITFQASQAAKATRRVGAARKETIGEAKGRLLGRAERVSTERISSIARRGTRAGGTVAKRRAEFTATQERRSNIARRLKWAVLAAAGSKYFLVQLGLGSFE